MESTVSLCLTSLASLEVASVVWSRRKPEATTWGPAAVAAGGSSAGPIRGSCSSRRHATLVSIDDKPDGTGPDSLAAIEIVIDTDVRL